MKKIILYVFLGLSLIANSYFIYENNFLKKENKKLQETPEIYWQNAIEKINNKNYLEAKEILNKLIENFPASNLVKNAKDKTKEINLIEKKKEEEEKKAIKSLYKELSNVKTEIDVENKLNFFDTMYDDTYPELKNIIKEEKDKIRKKIERKKEEQKENRLGGGYKNLKWGMSKKQVEQILCTKGSESGGGIYHFYLKEDTCLKCAFYNNKLYKVSNDISNLPKSGENSIDNVYKKLLQKFNDEFKEKARYNVEEKYYYLEDKYTKITLSCDKHGIPMLGYLNQIVINYESKSIVKQIQEDRLREEENRKKEYNESLNNKINNL